MWTVSFLVLWFLIHASLYGHKKNRTGGDLGASAILAFVPLGVLMTLLEYFSTDEGKQFLIWLLFGVGVFFSGILFIANRTASKRAEDARQRTELSKNIEHITKQEYIRGFQEKDNLGWVRTSGKETREAVEETLKVLAAELGANALVKYYWQSEKEKYQAGKGPKGNPYYKNRTIYGGEAIAVVLGKKSYIRSPLDAKASPKKKEFKKYSGKNLVLDGNNIIGSSSWDFDLLTKFMVELRQSKYDYTVFFDNNIFRTLKERELISKGQAIDECISNILGENPKNIVVTPKGEEADPYIIEHATRQNAAIISNDGYDDFKNEYPWLDGGERLMSFKVVGADILVPTLKLSAAP